MSHTDQLAATSLYSVLAASQSYGEGLASNASSSLPHILFKSKSVLNARISLYDQEQLPCLLPFVCEVSSTSC